MAKRVRGSKGVAWTRIMSERLCEAYQNEEMLYTIQHALYHNREARTEAWMRIALQLGVSADYAQARMENMRTQYQRFKKIQPDENGYVSSTHWLVGKLHFLDDYLKSRSGPIVSEQKYHAEQMKFVLDDDDGEMTDGTQLWDFSNHQSIEDSDETSSSQVLPDPVVLLSPRPQLSNAQLTGNHQSRTAVLQSTASAAFRCTGMAPVQPTEALSSHISDVRSSLETLNNAVTRMTSEASQSQLRQQQPTSEDDVHDAFAKYIAFELRQGSCNPQALMACKRDIFMAITRMQDACNAHSQVFPDNHNHLQCDVELKTEQ